MCVCGSDLPVGINQLHPLFSTIVGNTILHQNIIAGYWVLQICSFNSVQFNSNVVVVVVIVSWPFLEVFCKFELGSISRLVMFVNVLFALDR